MQTSIRGLSPQADGFRRHSNTEASVVGSLTNLTQCISRVSPMRTASGYQTPAVPYHTLICRSFSTPNTALVRKNAEYITNTKKGPSGRTARAAWGVHGKHGRLGKAAMPQDCQSRSLRRFNARTQVLRIRCQSLRSLTRQARPIDSQLLATD